MDIFYILAGFVGLIFGGDLLVKGAVSVATRLNVSPMVIGLTLVGFGTSTPELVTSIQAALAGSLGIAVGNVVGSNIVNILLILGIAALLQPIAISPAAFKRDGSVLTAVTLLCVVFLLAGSIGFAAGLIFLFCLAAYLIGTIWVERRASTQAAAVYEHEAELYAPDHPPLWKSLLTFAIGLAAILLAARFMVLGAISLAASLGVSEAIIGLTVVAIGTSLPELVTSIIAARRGQSDVAVGNIIGSNIFNILGILGTTSLVRTLDIPASIAAFDTWVMLGATLLLIVFARTGWRIGRREGLVLAVAYSAYVGFLVAQVS